MKHKHLFIFLLATFLLNGSELSFAVTPSAEQLFWQSPETVHSYKKTSDLHNLVGSIAALSDIELVRIGDALASFALRKHTRPFAVGLDKLHAWYYGIPFVPEKVPSVYLERILDALQLRQVSLSDARILSGGLSPLASGRGALVSPMMQLRVYKVIILLEDMINDADRFIMFPLNKSVSAVERKPVRVKTVGYLSPVIGLIRVDLFWVLRSFDRELVQFGSQVFYKVEDAHNILIQRKKMKENRYSMIYLRMPATVYDANQKFFKRKIKYGYIATPDIWKLMTNPDEVFAAVETADLTLPDQIRLSSDESLLMLVDAQSWTKAPDALRNYVITPDEFKRFISLIPSTA